MMDRYESFLANAIEHGLTKPVVFEQSNGMDSKISEQNNRASNAKTKIEQSKKEY